MARVENNLNLTNVNMDNLNKDWSNLSAKEGQTKFKQSLMTSYFKKHVEQTAQKSKERNSEPDQA
jgi:hypothetical protein